MEREEKKWGAKRLIKEFPGKRRPKTSITHLLQKTDNYGTKPDNRKEVGQTQ